MSAEFLGATGRVLTLRVSGWLTPAELAASQKAAGQVIEQLGKVRLLILVEDFKGTAKGDWNDLSFQMQYDPVIEKIGVVCDPQWENTALMFTGKGIRRVAIEIFRPADLERAKAWVNAD
jgi:hypothetical protein